MQPISNSVDSKSRWHLLFRIIGIFGIANLVTSFAWLYFWGRNISSYARESLDLHRPLGAQVMLVVGCVALIVAGSAMSGSKWVLWISMLGTTALVIGLAWLSMWQYFLVDRARGGYPWQPPPSAQWLVMLGCVALGVAGIAAIVLISTAWVRRLSKQLSAN